MRWNALPALLLWCCVAAGGAPPSAHAAGEPGTRAATLAAATDAGRRPCIGLVLGGGGARGAAHVGVLKVLERERIPVCAIAGTSMGAIVSALYASGMRPEEIEAALAAVDWQALFRDDPERAALPMRRKEAQLNYRLELEAGWRDGGVVLPTGAVQGQKLGLLLRRLMLDASGITRFDDLPIPFRAVATDIVRGERVVLAEGDLPLAVRASMAVPAVFAPAEIGDRLLVDGGIVDNVPVDVVRDMGADVVIAVDVGSPLLDREELRSPATIAYQMVSVLMQEKTQRTLATLGERDVLIVPPLGNFSSAAFNEAVSVIPRGEAAAEAELPRLRRYALPEAEFAGWRKARARAPASEVPTIAFVEVVEGRSRTARLVANRAQGLVGEPMEPERIERAVASAYAEGSYQQIGWRPVRRGNAHGVELSPVDKGWGPMFFNIGLQLSDDFAGRSDYQLTAELLKTGVSGDGDELRGLLRLGRTTELSLDWFAPLDLDRRFFFGADLGYRAFNVPLTAFTQQAGEYRVSRRALGLRLGLQTDPRWLLEATVRRADLDAREVVGTFALRRIDQQAMALGGRAVWDTLDRLSFPSDGTRAVLALERYEDWLGAEDEGWAARLRADTVFSRGNHHLLLGTRWASTAGAPPQLATFSSLGGFLNLSGVLERGFIGDRLGYGRAVYYRRLGDTNALFAVPTYLGFSLEGGQVWNTGQAFDRSRTVIAGSAFVGMSSPFGPILFGFGRTDRGDDTWSINFGNLIRNDD